MSLGLGQNPSITRQSTAHGLCTVTVTGEVDVYNAELLEDALKKACEESTSVILDFRECRYIDSSTVAVLLRCRKATGNPVHIITSETGAVRRVLAITQMDKVFIVTSGSDKLAS